MLTKTTEAGIQALVYLALGKGGEPLSPRVIAEATGMSPSYLSKVTGQLVRADILRAHRGARGGVTLSRPAGKIRLIEVVEALQGRIVGRYCEDTTGVASICAFHEAMHEVHRATVEVLSRWTLADLAARPIGVRVGKKAGRCLMSCLKDRVQTGA
ncbi:MAG: Rrf2 family transcriptional regulator [Candidatus Eisenbacteria bacterium]|nr:Rrf2 family transcriptional regulator [Candidatus Eisenbacteria bacterium]